MKKFIAVFMFVVMTCVAGVQAQNIQLHYDFGRSMYQELGGRSQLLNVCVESKCEGERGGCGGQSNHKWSLL